MQIFDRIYFNSLHLKLFLSNFCNDFLLLNSNQIQYRYDIFGKGKKETTSNESN